VTHEANWYGYYRLLARTTAGKDLPLRQKYHAQLQKHAKALRDLVYSNPSYMPLKTDACVALVRALLLQDKSATHVERISHGHVLHLLLSFLARAVTLSYEATKALVEEYVACGGALNLPVRVLTLHYHPSFEMSGMSSFSGM
jgi:hypothetical protein